MLSGLRSRERLSVVHVSTHDVRGGAARSTYRLHAGLRAAGHLSRMFVLEKSSADPDVVPFSLPMDLPSRMRRRWRRSRIARSAAKYTGSRPAGHEPFADDRTEYGASVARSLPKSDVINLHWVAGLYDFAACFAVLGGRTPIVWRLSDLNPMTGGCHYDGGCGKYVGGCGACPQLGSTDPRDLSHEIWQRKLRALKRIEPWAIRFVAQSRWMAEEVRRSALFSRFCVDVIPNGLDTNVFAPRDRVSARDVLGIPPSARVVLFVAASLGNRRKGLSELSRALLALGDQRVFVVAVGDGVAGDGRSPHLVIGHVREDRWLSLIYSAADVFVIPSLQDNLPNTVLEAMACGTPVVGFATGGIPDMVRPGLTGLLAPAGDVKALRDCIARILSDPGEKEALSRNCRRVVLEEYTLRLQVERFVQVYSRAIGETETPGAAGGERL